MNKVSVLAFVICAMALCFIGGYISVLHYEHSIAKSPPLFHGKDSSAIRDKSITTDIAILKSIQIHAKPYLRSEVTTESPVQMDQQLQIITKSPTFSPTTVVTKSRKPIQSALISSMKPVTSDVRGNLGPASAITNERMEDWLTDRWQGTSDSFSWYGWQLSRFLPTDLSNLFMHVLVTVSPYLWFLFFLYSCS